MVRDPARHIFLASPRAFARIGTGSGSVPPADARTHGRKPREGAAPGAARAGGSRLKGFG